MKLPIRQKARKSPSVPRTALAHAYYSVLRHSVNSLDGWLGWMDGHTRNIITLFATLKISLLEYWMTSKWYANTEYTSNR